MTLESLAKQGQATVYDSLAASIGPKIRQLRKDFIKESFSGLHQVEHRLELVAVIHGMEFINDSRSSNLNAAWYALESTSRPVIWIAGGLDSGNDYSMITSLVKRKVKGIVCLGLDVRRLHSAFDHLDIPMADASDMESAVLAAYYMGRTGYQILLSPACPSFDLFTNYEERGEAFRKAVKNI